MNFRAVQRTGGSLCRPLRGRGLWRIYRNLAQLETEEKVRRSSKSGTREVYFQYLDAESCKGALHMSCVKCGRTFHMASGNAALFAKHLAQSEQFTLDAADTVLYGTCATSWNNSNLVNITSARKC